MQIKLLTLLLMCSAACAKAQVSDTSRAMARAKSDMPGMSPHMTMTPYRAPVPGDSARAQQIVTQLRTSIAKYRDVNVALAEGFKPFLPNVKQDVYHFTKRGNAIKAALAFDPAHPTSLLYKKSASGYVLVGAMYTAPYRSSLADLDARVPLSIYPWHLHTDLCIPPRDQPARWRERQNGKPLFGPKGTITTQAACEAAGGTFLPHLFGWMVHVMTNPQSVENTLPGTRDQR
jgi:hypothetical protein